MERVQRVQAAHGERQYGEAWKVINEMTGRKRTKEGQVEGHSPEERVATWYNHFQKLLGTTSDGGEEEIPPFLRTALSRSASLLRQKPRSVRVRVLGRTVYPQKS